MNLIPVIAKELGVEFGEEFKLKLFNGDIWKNVAGTPLVFKFRNNGIMCREENSDVWFELSENSIGMIVCMEYEAIKLPFEPKNGDEYWTYFHPFKVRRAIWYDCLFDYQNRKLGCVFRTEAEALKARPIKYKELIGKEWEE